MPKSGSPGLRSLTLVGRALKLEQDGIGSGPDTGGGLQDVQHRLVAAGQFLHQKGELHLQVADALACIFCEFML